MFKCKEKLVNDATDVKSKDPFFADGEERERNMNIRLFKILTTVVLILTTFEETLIFWRSSSKDRKYNTALLVQMHPNEVDLKRSRLNNYSTEIVVNHKSFPFLF